jgi:hypothetical protein
LRSASFWLSTRFAKISGTVLAFEVKLFLILAKQTLDSTRHAFGDDFADDPMVSPSITRSRRKARFLTAKIERIPEAANTSCGIEAILPLAAEVLARGTFVVIAKL